MYMNYLKELMIINEVINSYFPSLFVDVHEINNTLRVLDSENKLDLINEDLIRVCCWLYKDLLKAIPKLDFTDVIKCLTVPKYLISNRKEVSYKIKEQTLFLEFDKIYNYREHPELFLNDNRARDFYIEYTSKLDIETIKKNAFYYKVFTFFYFFTYENQSKIELINFLDHFNEKEKEIKLVLDAFYNKDDGYYYGFLEYYLHNHLVFNEKRLIK